MVEDLPRSGRPSTSTTAENIDKIQKLVLENHHMSVKELAQELNISTVSVHGILNGILGIKRIASRLVPKELNFLQKEHRKQVADDIISRANKDPNFMKRIITGYEAWIYEFDTQTSGCYGNESKPKKPRRTRTKIKVMLAVFFDYRGVVHSEFLPEGQTINKDNYLGILRRLRESVRHKRSDLWTDNFWILHDDNVPSHRATIVTEYKAKHSINTIDQPPYSPDLAPSDFFLFPKLKLPLRGRRFETIEAIKQNSLKELKAIPLSAYERCMQDWVKRCHRCIGLDGAYYEGDNIHFDE